MLNYIYCHYHFKTLVIKKGAIFMKKIKIILLTTILITVFLSNVALAFDPSKYFADPKYNYPAQDGKPSSKMLYIQEVWAANGMVFYTGFVMKGTEGVYVDLGTGKCEVFEKNSFKTVYDVCYFNDGSVKVYTDIRDQYKKAEPKKEEPKQEKKEQPKQEPKQEEKEPKQETKPATQEKKNTITTPKKQETAKKQETKKQETPNKNTAKSEPKKEAHNTKSEPAKPEPIKLEVIKTKELYSADKTFLTLTFNFKAGEKEASLKEYAWMLYSNEDGKEEIADKKENLEWKKYTGQIIQNQPGTWKLFCKVGDGENPEQKEVFEFGPWKIEEPQVEEEPVEEEMGEDTGTVELEEPEEEKEQKQKTNIFVRIFNSIINFFKKLFGV